MSNDEKMCIIGFGRMGIYAAGLFSQDFQVKVVSSRDVGKDVTVGMAHYLGIALDLSPNQV